MLKKQPTASAIRTANRNAVGGGRKRCRKGKNCSATCIDAGKECLVGLPEPVSQATTRVAAMLQKKQGEGSGGAAASTQPQLSGTEAIQKFADDAKLKKLQGEAESYKQEWADTVGKGDPEKTKAMWKTYEFVKGQLDAFQKEYDDKYNRPVSLTPKEAMSQESKRVRDRIQDRIEEGVKYYKPEQKAPIIAAREEAYKTFKKLSDDELGALGLYGENKSKYYVDVNKFLRTGSMEGIPAERQQIVQNIIANMDGALNKLPATPQTELARAVSGGGARSLANLKVGDVIEDKGFGSYTLRDKVTALDQFFKSGQENALMRVTSKNARNVAPVMEFQREAEHILRPGTRLRVVEVIESGGANAHRSRVVGSVPTYIFEEVE